MKIYQCGGRLHAIDAAEVIEVHQKRDVQSCGGLTLNTGPPSAKDSQHSTLQDGIL